MILNIRQVRNFLYTARFSSVTHAAEELNRSQSAVSRSLQELENDLQVSLFDRTANGVLLTVYGKSLLQRAENVEKAFKDAQAVMQEIESGNQQQQLRINSPIFRMDVSSRRLASFIALAEQQNVAQASKNMNTTMAAVRSSIRELESILGVSLFERVPWGMVPTIYGETLHKFVKLISNELRQAVDDIANLLGVQQGHIRIGTMAFSQTTILPRAITRLLKTYPALKISTVEGTYNSLIASLQCGDLDFMIGALRESTGPELVQETLLEDDLSLIARHGHELTEKEDIGSDDLKRFGWVLLPEDTPSRRLFEDAITGMDLELPEDIVVTRSHQILRGLLLESDRISVLSRHQIYFEEKHDMLSVIPFRLRGTSRPIGITYRAQSTLSPGTRLLLEQIREVTEELK